MITWSKTVVSSTNIDGQPSGIPIGSASAQAALIDDGSTSTAKTWSANKHTANDALYAKLADAEIVAGIWNFADKLGIGTNTLLNQLLHIHETTSGNSYAKFSNTTTGHTLTDGLDIGIDSNEKSVIWNRENTDMKFGVNNLIALTIAASKAITAESTITATNFIQS